MKHALVTGAAGFLGQALVRGLLDRGYSVTATSRREQEHPDCDHLVADVRHPGALDASLRDDQTVIFHLAGHTSVAGSVADPEHDFESNVGGTLNVLQSARNAGSRVVFPSSPAVFAPGQPLPLAENADKGPVSPYGASKLAGEAYAQAFASAYAVDARIARIFNVYGPGMTRFAICDFYRKLKKNPHRLEMLGNGDQVRDYLFIDDAVDALVCIAEKGEAGTDYNVASGQPTRTIDLASLVAGTMGLSEVQITARGESFPGDIAKWYADISRLRALGFEPTVPLSEGLQRTIAWFETQAFEVSAEKTTC